VTISSWAIAKLAKLPAADTRDVVVERDLEVKMADGETLLADRWFAPSSVAAAPIVLLRSPYGRRQLGFFGRLFAERGYQAVIQSCRGTFGSGGALEPFRHERADGAATLEWLASQAWFTGSVGTFGPSYLGIVQWAVVADAPDYLKAVALNVTASTVRDSVVYPGGSFSLETGATWIDFVEFQERPALERLRALATVQKRTAPVYTTLPLRDADVRALGHRIDFYQDWLVHELPGDPWWSPLTYSEDLDRVPPATLVGGWYDIFLLEQVRDYVRLRAAGRPAQLTIGPWTHVSPAGGGAAVRDALSWFDIHLRGRPPSDGRDTVRLFVMGSGRWIDLPEWPPAADVQQWLMQPGGRLARQAPPAAPSDRYRYDPADPTPGVGGASLDVRNAGPRDQRRREERPDVLCYTSDPLKADVTVAGSLRSEVSIRTSQPYVDVFVRLCDVDLSGRSRNISDGVQRIDPDRLPADGDGIRRVRVEMWPTAMTFRRGHRIRLQVSSGAHPLFARNVGSGERLATASTLVATDVEVIYDPDHPSGIELPVIAI